MGWIINMEKSNKPQAKLLFKRVKDDLAGVVVPDIRARILKLLEDGNRELLPPNGITNKTDLYPFLPEWKRIWNDFTLPSQDVSMGTECYILSVIEVFRGKFGVILRGWHWESSRDYSVRIRNWIYPQKPDERF